MNDPNEDYPTPIWEAQGRNGYYMIDEFRENDPGHGTYGYPIGPFRSGGHAANAAAALNNAYARGYQHGMKDSQAV